MKLECDTIKIDTTYDDLKTRRKVEKNFRKLQINGTELYVDGEKVSPSQAAAYAVREESPYMADYILGEQGKNSQIRLDKVDLR